MLNFPLISQKVQGNHPLAWFENDVHIGLLIVAGYLCVLRLRNVTLKLGGEGSS